MRRDILITVASLCAFVTVSCDGYTYEGMDGEQALAASQEMNLPDAYKFYVETYTSTSPPMLDVAKTFRRFGVDGMAYVAGQALKTSDSNEFEAGMTALLILEHRCSQHLERELRQKAKLLGVDQTFVTDGCGEVRRAS